MMSYNVSDAMILQFLHQFPRPSFVPEEFSPYDPHYEGYLQFLVSTSMIWGFLLFFALTGLLMRRWKYAKDDAFAFRYAISMDLPTTILLSITILSALAGLLGEARVDYAVSVTDTAMKNTTHAFIKMQSHGSDMLLATHTSSATSADFLTAFGNTTNTKLPTEATWLVESTTTLRHLVTTEVEANWLESLPDLEPSRSKWSTSYKILKTSTNGVISIIIIASVVSIVSVAWSLSSPIRWALVLMMWTLPMAHMLIGMYMSGAIAGADFCVATENSTLAILAPAFNSTAQNGAGRDITQYYLSCKSPEVKDESTAKNSLIFETQQGLILDESVNNVVTAQPSGTKFNEALKKAQEQASKSLNFVEALMNYAKSLDEETTDRMNSEYLVPLESQLQRVLQLSSSLQGQGGCEDVHDSYTKAMDAMCQYGITGAFSLWLHQIALCILLLVCVVSLASVWERVEARDERSSRQYSLLGQYTDNNEMESGTHTVYLSPE